MIQKRFVLLYILLVLLCAREASAQPTCFVNYPLWYPCVFSKADAIFVGHVVSLIDLSPDERGQKRQVKVDRIYGILRGKAVLIIDTLLKGNVAGEVEVTFDSGCWGIIEVGKQYVFNVQQKTEGLYSDHWSEAFGVAPKDDEAQYIEMLRSLIRGERQPNVFGRLRHLGPGYYPQNGPPIPNVTVVAENDERKFETRTDADGRYQFRDLPDGEYRVYPLLPESLRPPDDDYGRPRERHDDRASVNKQILCGARVDFVVWDNGVIAGRVEDADGKPVKYLIPEVIAALRRRGLDKDADGRPLKWFHIYLHIEPSVEQQIQYQSRIREAVGLKDGEFAFYNLPPGPYWLEFYGGDAENASEGEDGKFVFLRYPSNAPDKQEARMINLAPGQKIRDIVIRLPIPNKK